MGIKTKIGLRGKISIIIVLMVLALSLALNYYTANNLASAINKEYIKRAVQLANIIETELEVHSADGALGEQLIQEAIESVVARNDEIEKVSVYAPSREGVIVLASSMPELVGQQADEEDAAPIFTGETQFVEKDRVSAAEGLGEADYESGAAGNLVEMLAPLHDSSGNTIASLGIYLDAGERDGLILSQKIKFAVISNLGLLMLVVVFYLVSNRFLIRPIKALTCTTGDVVNKDWSSPMEAKRKDEIGDLARAFDELSMSLGSREEEVRLLLGVSFAVSSELHVDKILQILCEKIAASQKVTYCRIALIDENSNDLVIKAASTTRDIHDWEDGVGQRIAFTHMRHHRKVLETKEPYMMRRSVEGGEDTAEWQWTLSAETESALLLPLISKGEVLGIVTLGEVRTWERSPFSAKKIEFYQILMSQAAVAIEKARLYEMTEWQVHELSIMHKVSQAFTSTLDYQEVVSIVAEKVGKFIGAQYASVLLPDEQGRYLDIVASYNLSAEYVWTINKKARVQTGSGPLGKAFIEQKPVVVDDVSTDPLYDSWKHIASVQGYSSLIALPLMAKAEAIGVLCIYFAEPRYLKKNEINLMATAANEAAIAIENAHIHENLQDAFIGTIKSLAETIDAKDAYTRGHSEKVSLYAEAIARSLGLGGDELQTIRYAGYLHDVGKIGIPDAILTKPGKLTVEEFAIIKKHPVLSDRILMPVEFPFPVQPLVRHHHERYDGKGYPDNLRGEEIPLGARILAVADSYEAMTSDRPYRKALSVTKALEELECNRGTQFDARAVEELIKIVNAETPSRKQMRKGA